MKIETTCSDLVRMTGLEAVVCATDPALRAHGDAALMHRAGPEVAQAVLARAPVQPGAAVETPAGGLGARWLIHAAVLGARPAGDPAAALVRDGTRSALAVAERLGCGAVALPDLGAAAGVAAPDAAAAMLDAVWAHLREQVVGSLQHVVFVLPTRRHRDVFQQALAAREAADPLYGDPEGDAPTEVRTVRDPLPSPLAAWPDGALPSSTHALDGDDWADPFGGPVSRERR